MFEWIISVFNLFIHQPLLNMLILFYQYIPGNDFGLAIIALTIAVRVAMYPLNQAAIRSQKALADLQPHIKSVQDAWKHDKERQVRETLTAYKKANINPLSSLFLAAVQLPVLIALFRIFGTNINDGSINSSLYPFVVIGQQLDPHFLGVINLAEPNFIFSLAAGGLQFVQTKMLSGKALKSKNNQGDFSEIMQKQALYFLPLLTVFVLLNLPSALAFYWVASTIFAIGQQYLLLKKKSTNT